MNPIADAELDSWLAKNPSSQWLVDALRAAYGAKSDEHLMRELARCKQMLTEVYEKKHRWEKQKQEYGEKMTHLNNENQKLRSRLKKLESATEIVPASEVKTFSRRRWKTSDSTEAA